MAHLKGKAEHSGDYQSLIDAYRNEIAWIKLNLLIAKRSKEESEKMLERKSFLESEIKKLEITMSK